jgi:hypothetical protein
MFNNYVIKQHMHHAITAGIFEPKEVVTITVSLQHISDSEAKRWQEDEISYEGKMYDVISKRQQGGNLIVQCLCDDDETNLIGSFLSTMQRNHQFSSKGIRSFQHLFSPFILGDNWCSFTSTVHHKIQYAQLPDSYMSKGFTYVPAPPPWQV